MIKDSSYKKLMIGVSAFVLVAIIGIAYAAFTGNLSISGTGINRKSNYDIYFNNVSDFNTTGTASVVDEHPTSKTHTTIIEDYEATLITPGDSIYFTFDIVNDGDYDATLTNLMIGPAKCSVNGNESDSSAVKVCNNITYTMKYTDNNSNVSVNDTLASKETKSVKVTLTYNSNILSSDLPTSNVTITNLGIDMVYTADTTAKTNSDGSTPQKRYTIGEEVTVQSEKYNVIGVGSDYVTLLKQQPLTANEVNLYGGVGTDNNHVNMYVTSDTMVSYYQRANDRGDINHTGGMAYYSSPTCGEVNGSMIYDGCTADYNNSDVKYVVDAWAADKFTNELKIVDGYNARLAQKEEIRTIGWPSCSSTASHCPIESATPSWIWSSNYWYWTISPYGSSVDVWNVGNDGNLSNYNGYYTDAVRPVINVYKSAIQS